MTRGLPPGWVSSRLGDLVSGEQRAITDGPFGSNLKTAHYTDAGPRVIRLQNIGDGVFKREDAHISREHYESLIRHSVQEGDLVVASLGETLPRACLVPSWLPPAIVKADCIRVRLHHEVSAAYVNYALQHPALRRETAIKIKGVGRPRLGLKGISDLRIPVAPRCEQERVVAAIEEHFSRIDAVGATQRRIIRQINVLKSSLLSDAFRTNGNLPPRWEQKTIGEVAQVQLGRQRSPQHHSGPQMRSYLRSANVTWEGISLDDVKEMNFDDADFETYKLEPGDLLLNEASGSPGEVGKPAIWNGEIKDCCFQNTLLRLRSAEVDIRYLYWYCYASALSGRFGDAGRGVNIRHLGKGGLAQFPIPVAPRDQQGQIAAQLDQQLEQAKRLEHTAQEVLNRVAALRQAVLSQAFSGHLAPQDPNDEPASALLERIARSR